VSRVTVPNDPNDPVLRELQELRARVAMLERGPRLRPWIIAGAVGGVLVGISAMGASAACPNGIPYCFNANEPALATEVNADFAALKTWLEAKVGATGALATPSNDISTRDVTARNISSTTETTSSIVATSFSPPYTSWATVGLGAGGAAIQNDNMSYKALMLVGNTSAGGARKIRMYDDVDVNGLFTTNGYEVSCAGGRSGYHYGFCCRMNKRTGATDCKNGTTTSFAGWSQAPSPFSAGPDSHYSLSCTGTIDSANWPICCRTDFGGSTACVVSVNAGPLTWNTSAPAPW
jgi:hypothetical protein